jgi:hypothetical protein
LRARLGTNEKHHPVNPFRAPMLSDERIGSGVANGSQDRELKKSTSRLTNHVLKLN